MAPTDVVPSRPQLLPPLGLRVRRGQVATGAAAILVVLLLGWGVSRSESVLWSEIPRFLVDPRILGGVLLTLELTFGAMVFGVLAGGVLAAMATSGDLALKAIAAAFVWWFRGVPLLVQVFFWYNVALFVPAIGWGDHAIPVNDLVTPAVAGFLALGLHEAANMAEIIRAGLRSVGQGQREAAQALGLGPLQTLWTVVVPQAARLAIPPTGNQAIGMLKASAIVSVIGMKDLLTMAQQIYAANFLVIELLFVASIWYLALTSVASIGQHYLEKHLAAKDRR